MTETKLYELLRELVENEPLAHDNDAMWHSCTICGAAVPVETTDHEPDCVWRRAKEYLDETRAAT